MYNWLNYLDKKPFIDFPQPKNYVRQIKCESRLVNTLDATKLTLAGNQLRIEIYTKGTFNEFSLRTKNDKKTKDQTE